MAWYTSVFDGIKNLLARMGGGKKPRDEDASLDLNDILRIWEKKKPGDRLLGYSDLRGQLGSGKDVSVAKVFAVVFGAAKHFSQDKGSDGKQSIPEMAADFFGPSFGVNSKPADFFAAFATKFSGKAFKTNAFQDFLGRATELTVKRYFESLPNGRALGLMNGKDEARHLADLFLTSGQVYTWDVSPKHGLSLESLQVPSDGKAFAELETISLKFASEQVKTAYLAAKSARANARTDVVPPAAARPPAAKAPGGNGKPAGKTPSSPPAGPGNGQPGKPPNSR